MVEDVLKRNSFHDGYITTMKYYRETERVKMNIVQLYSELDIAPSERKKFKQDDLVEIEFCVENVCYVSSEEIDYSEYDIIDVIYEQKDGKDILVYKLHMFGGYKEICIKGIDIRIRMRINKKIVSDE